MSRNHLGSALLSIVTEDRVYLRGLMANCPRGSVGSSLENKLQHTGDGKEANYKDNADNPKQNFQYFSPEVWLTAKGNCPAVKPLHGRLKWILRDGNCSTQAKAKIL